MISTLLSTIGLPVLIKIVGEALAQVDSPLAQGASRALGDFNTALEQGQVTQEQMVEANRHAEKMAEMEFRNQKAVLSEVNTTIRQELKDEDKYVRRMRPTFGYLMALTWAAQMLAVAYVIVFDTAKSVIVLNGMGSLSVIWTIGLSVLGVYVYKRSEEKKVKPPETIFWNSTDK